jgi:hypothetical protein
MQKTTGIIVVFITLLLQISCKKRSIQQSSAVFSEYASDSAAVLLKDLPEGFFIRETTFDYLKFKSKVGFSSASISQSFPATIQVKKDSAIWISVTMGIEIARCLVTTDSIQLMDRINRKYYEEDLSDLSRRLGFNLNFGFIQSMLSGNLAVGKSSEDRVIFQDTFNRLIQTKGNIRIENHVESNSGKLIAVLAGDPEKKNKFSVSFSDFLTLSEGNAFPQTVSATIETSADAATIIEFSHNKIELGESGLRFPYSVPRNYEKGKILF